MQKMHQDYSCDKCMYVCVACGDVYVCVMRALLFNSRTPPSKPAVWRRRARYRRIYTTSSSSSSLVCTTFLHVNNAVLWTFFRSCGVHSVCYYHQQQLLCYYNGNNSLLSQHCLPSNFSFTVAFNKCLQPTKS